ncbi:MAG TPA: hypothetical protein VK946_00765 [Methylotenera sp.]|nr:hypothetical protein [Methylotenera sp.]
MLHLSQLLTRRTNTPRCYALVVLLSLSILPAQATQLNSQFNVTVNLQTAASTSNSAFCRMTDAPGSFGAAITIVCTTGAIVDISPDKAGIPNLPTHGGAYRYLFQASLSGNLLGTIDSYVGTGTATSWRIINLTGRDYLEMLVNW